MPSTPIFGGVKHFMPAMPYLAVDGRDRPGRAGAARCAALAARGAARAARAPLPVALAALVCLPARGRDAPLASRRAVHYNLLAGGFAGGASLGMNRQFWGYSVLPMLPTGSTATAREPRACTGTTCSATRSRCTSAMGGSRLEVGDTGFGEAGHPAFGAGILFYEKHWAMYEGWFWDSYGTTQPAFVRDARRASRW